MLGRFLLSSQIFHMQNGNQYTNGPQSPGDYTECNEWLHSAVGHFFLKVIWPIIAVLHSLPSSFSLQLVVVVVWQISCRGSYHFLKRDCVADAVPLYQYTHTLEPVLISPTSEG